jgi:integrase
MAVVKRGNRYRAMTRVKTADGWQQVSRSFDTQREAERWVKTTKSENRADIASNYQIYMSQAGGFQTIASYAQNEWLPNHRLEPNSRRVYENILRKHILPYIGDKALKKITRADIKIWFRQMDNNKVSGAMQSKTKAVASAMFSTALDDELIPANPVAGVKVRQPLPRRRRPLTPDEYQKLMAEIPAKYQLFIRTAVETGCRWEELIELRGKDVHGSYLDVDRTYEEVSDTVRQYTKNHQVRDVELSPSLAAELAKVPRERLIFPGRLDHLSYSYTIWKVFKPALKRAGIEGVTFHDLRATSANWAEQQGMSPTAIRNRYGWAETRTADRYLRGLAGEQHAAVSGMGKLAELQEPAE